MHRLKGHFTILNDSTIQLQNQQTPLDGIQQSRPVLVGQRIVGGILSAAGTLFVVPGIILSTLFIFNDVNASNALALVAGLLMIEVGILPTAIGYPMLLVGRKYDLQEKWRLSVHHPD